MVQIATQPDQTSLSQGDPLALQLAEALKETKLHKDSFPILVRLKKLKHFFQAAYNFFAYYGWHCVTDIYCIVCGEVY